MGTIIDITQYKLDRVLANEEVSAKIKLRRLSHANLLEHVKNIPHKIVRSPEVNSATFNFPLEQKKMGISPKKYIQLVTGHLRPINVKEDKIENIRRHSDILVSMANTTLNIDNDVSIEPDVVSEERMVQELVQEIPSEVSSIVNEVVQDDSNMVDVSEYIARLNNETQLIKNVKEEALLAQQQAVASDEDVNKLSVEVSELEKKEAAIAKQNQELDRKIIDAYENQTRTLALARKEYEDLIKEANAKKEANDNKIVEFQSRKEIIRNSITDGNESIARKQGILSAFQQNEFYDINVADFSDYTTNEEKVKRIA